MDEVAEQKNREDEGQGRPGKSLQPSLWLLDTEAGGLIEEGRPRTTPEALRGRIGSKQPMKIASLGLAPTRRG